MISEPPAQPKCDSETADLFDMEWTYPMALAMCDECPVREWCLDTVDPARSFYDGVAGGIAWKEGRPINRYKQIWKDETLINYLARRGMLKRLPTDRW